MADLVQEARSVARLDAWRSVFEKTNRIVSERPLRVVVERGSAMPVPSWTDGETITFNGDFVEDTLKHSDAVSAVLSLKGLNYHELAHVLYTPRMGDELPRLVRKRCTDTNDSTYWYAFNALEDQRIETWFTSVFGASRRYFEATVMAWIIREATVEAAPLTYGRKYLPSHIRVGAGQVFVQKHGQALYDEFKDVIDQYVLLTFPAQAAKGYTLVLKFKALMDRLNTAMPSLPVPDNGCSGHGTPSTADPTVLRAGRVQVKSQRVAKEAAAKASAQAAEQDKATQEAAAQQQGQGKGQDGQAEAAGNSEGQGQGQGQPGQGEAAGAPSATEGGGQEDGGTGAGTDAAPIQVASKIGDLINQAREELTEVKEDEQVLRDVQNTLDAVKAKTSGGMDAAGSVAGTTTHAATDPQKTAVRKIVKVLGRIRVDLEAAKVRQQPSGRINVRRYLSRQPHDVQVFDQWEPGHEDEASVEAVLMLDVSGSMRDSITAASGALWVLKRSFDKAGIRTTALVYNGGHAVLFQPSTKAQPSVPVLSASGGTDPTSAYDQATMILSQSKAMNKVLVNLTDGQWAYGDDHWGRYMKTLHSLEVSTMLLGLDDAVQQHGKHGHKIGYDISDVAQLPKAVTSLVSDILRNVAQQD